MMGLNRLTLLWQKIIYLFFLFLVTGCGRYQVEEMGVESLPKAPYRPAELIVVDAGHGGKDQGCQTYDEAATEKALTLQTVLLVKEHLQKLGYRVVLTRNSDMTLSLDKRTLLANELNPALFVSVHFNTAENKAAEGIEVFYYKQSDDPVRTQESQMLAQCLLRQTVAATEAKSRGVKVGNYRVIKKTTMPAALIEAGFLSHPREAKRCQDPIYLDAIAWGIARGVDNYFAQLQ